MSDSRLSDFQVELGNLFFSLPSSQRGRCRRQVQVNHGLTWTFFVARAGFDPVTSGLKPSKPGRPGPIGVGQIGRDIVEKSTKRE